MEPMIRFQIQNQSIVRTDTFRVYSSSKNYLRAEFTFLTDDWNGLTKTAIFEYKDDRKDGVKPGVRHVLLEGDHCAVPHEALEKPGTLNVSVFAGDRVTAGKAFVRIYESGYADGAPPDPSTPDLYEQIVGASKDALERANEVVRRVDGTVQKAEAAVENAAAVVKKAETALEKADKASQVARDAGVAAEQAAYDAKSAAESANAATSLVNTAMEYAYTSARAAEQETKNVKAAAGEANGAASSANNAASAATNAANVADASALNANEAAKRADIAAERAEAVVEEAGKTVTRYGVRFEGSANSGETVHRLYNAVDLVAGVGTDTETAVNDFDSVYPWSARRRCCGYWNEDGNFVVNAYAGEPGYAVDGSNGEVWVEHSLFYYKHTYGEDGSEEIVISATPLVGYLPAPIFLSGDGTLYQKAYTAAYPMATVDGKATSRSGVFCDAYSLNSAVTAARTLGDRFTVTQTAEWYTECLYMWVEFATRHLQRVMAGASNMPHTTDEATVAETSANRFITTNAVADKFVVGQTVGVGTEVGTASIANNRIVTSIDTYDANNKAICFDGDPVNIAVGNIIFTLAWKNGSCDGVLSSSGSPVSNTSGKYSCVYRGKERPYGDAFEQISDVLLKREGAGTTEDPYTYDPYFLPDTTKYNNGTLTEDYVKLNFGLPTGDGYVKALGLDDRFPWVRIPCECGAAAATWYSDYCYYPRSALCSARVGGYWTTGTLDGPVCWHGYSAPSYSFVSSRARLSYRRK